MFWPGITVALDIGGCPADPGGICACGIPAGAGIGGVALSGVGRLGLLLQVLSQSSLLEASPIPLARFFGGGLPGGSVSDFCALRTDASADALGDVSRASVELL